MVLRCTFGEIEMDEIPPVYPNMKELAKVVIMAAGMKRPKFGAIAQAAPEIFQSCTKSTFPWTIESILLYARLRVTCKSPLPG